MTRVFLDDERDPREWLPHMRWFRGRSVAEFDEWVWAKTAPDAIEILAMGPVSEVSLDHDLGPEEIVGTGYDVLTWIEERVASDPGYEPSVIHIHTSNIGSRDRMESAVVGIANLLERRTEESGARSEPHPVGEDAEKPLLLVDFDGVINIIGQGTGRARLEADFKREGYRIRVPVGMAARFARLEEVYECVWATTWGQEAQIPR